MKLHGTGPSVKAAAVLGRVAPRAQQVHRHQQCQRGGPTALPPLLGQLGVRESDRPAG